MKDAASVLVVDDNVDLLDTFKLILKRKGFNVDTASDGLTAIDKVQSRSFDVVLMDVIMPRMNGIEAFQKIREINPDIKVIMMTAYSEEEQFKNTVDNGAYCALHKPINISHLMEIIGDAVAEPLILIVDDDDDFRTTLTRALELKGHSVISANSGKEAIKITQAQRCQIALVDLKMPLMDGVETYLKLREINSNLAAVLMTGYREEMSESMTRAIHHSTIGCLYKPFDPSQVLSMVKQLRKSAKNGDINGRQRENTNS